MKAMKAMKTLYLPLLILALLSMVSTKAFAYDIAVENADGVKIYYNYFNNRTELEVTYLYLNNSKNEQAYRGTVNIPDQVTIADITRKVTSIGDYVFNNCTGLTSVIIPNGVTSIGLNAFQNCIYTNQDYLHLQKNT